MDLKKVKTLHKSYVRGTAGPRNREGKSGKRTKECSDVAPIEVGGYFDSTEI